LIDRFVAWGEAQAEHFRTVWEQGLDAPLGDWAIVLFLTSGGIALVYFVGNALASARAGGGFFKTLVMIVLVVATLVAIYVVPGLYLEDALEGELGGARRFEPPYIPNLPAHPRP
jgi:hypothetical protein